jgi:CBS domain containing-hemolysin-like protein
MSLNPLILTSLLFILFFSGTRIAFMHSDRLRFELDLKNGVVSSEIFRLFTDYAPRFHSSMHVGLLISRISFIACATGLSLPFFLTTVQEKFTATSVVSIFYILITLLFMELVSRALFLISPNFFLRLFSIPALIFFLLLYPIVRLIMQLPLFINRNSQGHKDFKAIEEAVFLPVQREGSVNQNKINSVSGGVQNALIFRNALDFSNVKLREIMVPRTEIEAVSISSSPAQIKEVFIATKFSRILVYRDTIDTVTGYIEVRDIYVNPVSIEPMIRKITIVPETMPASRLLKMFVNEKMNIALVVDEFGGTSGMVTTEDLLEEIVGDIEDEHDTTDLIEKPVGQNEFIFSGRFEIDYLNEKYHFYFPEQADYETLAGMILFHHGSIPGNNETIRIRNFVIKILRASTTKIEVVKLKIE